MKQTKIFIALLLLIGAGAVAWNMLNKPVPAEQAQNQKEEEFKPDTYTIHGVIKEVDINKLKVDVTVSRQDDNKTPFTYSETKLVTINENTELLKVTLNNGKSTTSRMNLSQIKPGQKILITTSANPSLAPEFEAIKIQFN